MTTYRPVPQFNTTILSATAVNELSRLIGDLYNRGRATAVPQPLLSGTDAEGGSANHYRLVFEGRGAHQHFAAGEYLYYDILAEGTGTCEIYVGDIEPKDKATKPPIVTLTATGARQRGLVAFQTWPTAGTHPDDEDDFTARVYACRDADTDYCTVTVYALQIFVGAAAGYQALSSATALVDGQTTTAPTDLQKLSDNCALLDDISGQDIPAFRSLDRPGGILAGTSVTLGPLVWNATGGGRIYYHLNIEAVADRNPTLTLQWQVDGADVGTPLIYTKSTVPAGTAVPNTTPSKRTRVGDVDGYFDLPAANIQQQLSVGLVCTIGNSSNPSDHWFVRINYLDEMPLTTLPAGWVQLPSVAHLDKVWGDGAAVKLRDFYDDVKYLAGDDGSGYGKNGDADAYPAGYALIACRNHLMQVGHSASELRYSQVQLYGSVWNADIGEKSYKCQQACFRRVRDFLYYRARGAKLCYYGRDGLLAELGLLDYTDTEPFQVLDLRKVKDLQFGQVAFIRVNVDAAWDGVTVDPPILDYAYQRF